MLSDFSRFKNTQRAAHKLVLRPETEPPQLKRLANLSFHRRFVSTTVALALSGFALYSTATAAAPTPPENPYHRIAARNVFRLRAPPPTLMVQPAIPLPKITLSGIITLFGDKRALLKVEFPPNPLGPAKSQSFILAEGKHEGQIGVLAINEKTACVKVDNCGSIVEITFEKAGPAPPSLPPTITSFRAPQRANWLRPPTLPGGFSAATAPSSF